MNIKIKLAAFEEKSIIGRMLDLYLYDLSEFSGGDLNKHGVFGYHYLDLYWIDEERFPYIIRVNGKLAGFVLVGAHIVTEEAERTISEFFVLRKFRKKQVGTNAARQVFDLHPGIWEVRTFSGNKPAIEFWGKVIREASRGSFKFLKDGYGSWGGPLWTFSNNKAEPVRRRSIV